MLKELNRTAKTVSQTEIDDWYLAKLNEGEELDLLRISAHNKPEHYIPPSDHKLGNSLWTDIVSGGSFELKKIFGKKVFDNPKPVDLIKRIINMTSADKDAVILDSFAGSGTTGQAVLELNKEDGGNRKFILVELEKNIARKVTAERIKRVIKGYEGANFPEGTGQGFHYLDLNGELYNQSGTVNPQAQYEDMAAYIFFTETKQSLDIASIDNPLIGSHGSTHYFLYFQKNGNNILDEVTLKKINGYNGTKVIYADKCLLDEEYLSRNGIIFKQVPYELKKY
jgi:adenine-specific DNA-methyltransferase